MPMKVGSYIGEAFIVFSRDGTPDFIDGNMTEAEMRSWYRNQLMNGGYVLRCHIFEKGAHMVKHHGKPAPPRKPQPKKPPKTY